MMPPRARTRVGDLSGLPGSANGPRNLVWWGNTGFMLIEGTGFALAIGALLYLFSQTSHWPPSGDRAPSLVWSGIFTALLVASELPNLWLIRQAKAHHVANVRWGMLAMTGIGMLLLAARWFELQHLNVRWDRDAYASVVWMAMVLHSTHIVTELGESAVITAWLFTHSVGDDQFCDVEDNGNYWTFVVLAWLPIYALVYWMPRWA